MKKFFTHADLVVPAHHPRVLVETAVQQGADRFALLEGTSVTLPMLQSPDARFSYHQFGVLVRNALVQTGNPALGLDYGRNIRLSHLGVLGLAVMSSRTVGDALEVALRHYKMLSPAWDLALRVANGRAILSARETIPLAPFSAFAAEGLLTGFHTLGEILYGGPVALRALRLAYPEPSYSDRYRALWKLQPVFDSPVNEGEFDDWLLDAPIAGADPATLALAEQYCEERAPPVGIVDGLVAQMRRLLGAGHGPPPDLEKMARMLQTSTRTLRRSLQEMKTSYSELLDETRRTRAEEWVRTTPKKFEQIAHELGFSNVRSFRRAYKRWTGFTPGAARAAAFDEATAMASQAGNDAPRRSAGSS